MKKILQTLGVAAAMTAGVQANAQIPDYGVFPAGFVITDINGGTHDVDAILDAGKCVLIDAFADWCGPCWTYHQAGTLESLDAAYGPSGTNQVEIFGLEADPGEPESTISNAGSGQGDWTLGGTISYALADDDNISGVINLGYYPTLILICPDRTVTEVGQASLAAWQTAIDACGSNSNLSTDSNDPRIVSNETDPNVTLCGGGTAAATIVVGVQNNSNAAISGSYDIEATLGGTVVASTTATLTLAPYEAIGVTVGSAALALGSNNVVVTITTANDDLTNDDITVPVTVEQAANLGAGNVDLDITFDGYGSEVGYGLASGTVQETDPFAAYPDFNGSSYPGQIEFQAIGTWANTDTDYSTTWTGMADGCYHLYMFDNYGDGLTVGSNGDVTLSAASSASMNVDYGSGGWFTFELVGNVGMEEFNGVDFAKVFPNPAVDMTNVQFNLTEASDVTVEVMNTFGQIVFSDKLGEVNGLQNVEVATSDLESGIYLININVNGNVLTKRISVIK
ncbi:MAG: hypothetical protein ACI857_001369 [Arenicella sp.]|jgi:hypothetical protein